jgi:PTS system N-acetylglucosamine-specific IIA component
MSSAVLHVLAPVSGTSRDVADMPDPVFAGGVVGPGIAIEPQRTAQTVLSPVDGRLAKLHPHAFVVVSDAGPGVLVHLGIDTVHLHGDGFDLLATEHDRVAAGEGIVTWDPRRVVRTGHSPMCAVVVLDRSATLAPLLEAGSVVHAADPILDVDC